MFNQKRGQFFIIAAVIIAVALVGLATFYNTVNFSTDSKKFYRYSETIPGETSKVVDYSLYSGNDKLDEFIIDSMNAIGNTYPGIDIFTCYSSSEEILTCKNYGNESLTIFYGSQREVIQPLNDFNVETCQGDACTSFSYKKFNPTPYNFTITGLSNIIVLMNQTNYTIDLSLASQSNQFYFLFREAKGEEINVATT